MLKSVWKKFCLDTDKSLEEEESTEYYWGCDSCSELISEGTLHYHCPIKCTDFDLCQACYEQKGHEHKMYAEVFSRATVMKKLDYSSIISLLESSFKVHSELPCFGTINEDCTDYDWITYKQVYEKITNLAEGLRDHLGIERRHVCICAPNSIDWIVVDIACQFLGHVIIPISHHITKEHLETRLELCDAEVMICHSTVIDIALECLSKLHKLKHVIELTDKFDSRAETTTGNLSIIGMKISWAGIKVKIQESDIVALHQTSGSTGPGKFVIFTEETNIKDVIPLIIAERNRLAFVYSSLTQHVVRNYLIVNIAAGAPVAIFTRNFNYIFEDIRLVNPTQLSFTPRILTTLYNRYKNESFIKDKHIDIKTIKAIEKSLGNRLKILVLGGAPIGAELLNFLQTFFPKVFIGTGYGLTEIGSVTKDERLIDSVKIKLIDIPELGYLQTDKPFPRGELCVKGGLPFLGYYKNPKLSEEVVDSEGYYHTGDIVELRYEKQVKIIDRIKNVLKLSQGKMVCPEEIENILIRSDYVSCTYVYGNGLRSFLVAVVVPQADYLNKCAASKSSKEIKFLIVNDFLKVGKENGLLFHEIPKAIILETEPFTLENGLLTHTHKLARHAIENRYKQQLEDLYANVDDNQLLKHHLNFVSSKSLDVSKGYVLDSLDAIELQNLLKFEMNIDIPLENLLRGDDVLSMIKERKFTQNLDLKIESQLSTYFLENIEKSTVIYNDTKNVLITGATGFLGCYICRELLSKYETISVYCLVKSKDDFNAKIRVLDTLKFYGIYESSFDDRLFGVSGDITLDNMGVSSSYTELCENIDSIYHSAAAVNFAMNYSDLRAVNVNATKALLDFAVTSKRKSFNYISTTSVEQLDGITDLTPFYNTGYATSKYIAEFAVSKASEYGLRTSIIRAGMIFCDSQFGGCNLKDWLTSFINACFSIKAFPEDAINKCVNVTHVDDLAELIVQKTIHTPSNGLLKVNDVQRVLRYRDLFQIFKINSESFKSTSLDTWKSMLQQENNNNMLRRAAYLFNQRIKAIPFDEYPSDIVVPTETLEECLTFIIVKNQY